MIKKYLLRVVVFMLFSALMLGLGYLAELFINSDEMLPMLTVAEITPVGNSSVKIIVMADGSRIGALRSLADSEEVELKISYALSKVENFVNHRMALGEKVNISVIDAETIRITKVK